MSDPDQRIEKIKLPVEIERSSGVSTGFVFLMPQSRLSDLMNDSRQFLPFETYSGKFSAVSKATILSVTPLDGAQKERRYEGDDPYRILGVSEDAEMEDIRQAYLRLCAEHHPDRIKGMGLSAEYVELANTHMARVNDAFQRINERRGTNGYANGSAHDFDSDEDDAWESAHQAEEHDATRQARKEEKEAARKAAKEEAARKAEERLARLAEEEAAREAEVIEAARKAAEEKTARLIAEEAERQAAEEESKRPSKENEIAQRAESAVLRAQAEIARKVEERAARMAQEDKPARAPKSAPKSAADSLRRAAHDLAREKGKKAG